MASSKLLSSIQLILSCLISWFITIILFIPISINLMLLSFYKYLVNCIVKFKHPGWVPLNGIDIGHAGGLSSTTNQSYINNIGYYIILNGDISIEQLRKHINTQLIGNHYNELQKLFKLPVQFMFHYYWTNPIPIDQLDWNVLVTEYKSTTYKASAFVEFLNTFIHQPYKIGHPLWQICLYKDCSDEFIKKSVMIIKISHCICDGLSLAAIANRIHGFKMADMKPGPMKNVPWSAILKSQILSPLFWPLSVYQLLSKCHLRPGPIAINNHGREYLYSVIHLYITKVKGIKRSLNCSFNDVITAVLGGMINKLQNNLFRGNAPVKMNHSSFATIVCPTGSTRRGKDIIKNDMAVAIYGVPLVVNSSERIKSIRKQTKFHKNYGIDRITRKLIAFPYIIPSFLFKWMNRGNSEPYITLSVLPMISELGAIENIPLQQMLSCASVLNEKCYLMCICLSSSTSPQMTLSFVGNKNVFKDHVGMDTFASYAIDELRDLWNDCRQEC